MLSPSTCPARRLALQLAIQLPADIAEARRTLELTHELLDDFMVEPGPARRRAMLLGWGAAGSEEPDRSGWWRAPALALATLLVSMPVACAISKLAGGGGSVPLVLGVAATALLLGAGPALLLSAASLVLFNLVVMEPWLFNRPHASEYIVAGIYLTLSLAVPWIDARRRWIDAWLRSPPAAELAPPRSRRRAAGR